MTIKIKESRTKSATVVDGEDGHFPHESMLRLSSSSTLKFRGQHSPSSPRTLHLLLIACVVATVVLNSQMKTCASTDIQQGMVPRSQVDGCMTSATPFLNPRPALMMEYNYAPAVAEKFFLEHGYELGLNNSQHPLPRGCAEWTNPNSPIAKELATFRTELDEFNRRYKAFTLTNITDLRQRILETNDHSVCDSLELHPDGLGGIFSEGILTRTASGAWMEPIAPPLRSHGICWNQRNWVMSLDYLIHDYATYCRKLKPTSRIVLVDMGAALDFNGARDSPAIYLTQNYERFGFHFDHIYAYEMQSKNPNDVFQQVPTELLHAWHWMNVGVTYENDPKLNPFEMLVRDFKQDDFVVVKLDIDTPEIEHQLAMQLLENKRLHEIVDVFYFEHHVYLGELARPWARMMRGSVQSSIELFTGLRKAGVDAHYWV